MTVNCPFLSQNMLCMLRLLIIVFIEHCKYILSIPPPLSLSLFLSFSSSLSLLSISLPFPLFLSLSHSSSLQCQVQCTQMSPGWSSRIRLQSPAQAHSVSIIWEPDTKQGTTNYSVEYRVQSSSNDFTRQQVRES